MGSFSLNHGPENYNWMLPNVLEGASEEEVRLAPQIPWLKMAAKVDGLVMLIPTIPIVRPITPPPQQPAAQHEEAGPPMAVPHRPRLR